MGDVNMGKHNKKRSESVTTFEFEKLKTEFMLMNVVNLPSSLEDARCLIESYIDDMVDVEHRAKREILRNNVNYGLGKIENAFLEFMYLDTDDLSYLDDDLGVILSQRALGSLFKRYFSFMSESLSDDNYQELSKLAIFTNKKYLDNYEHLESVRDCITCGCLGLSCTSSGEETRMAYDEFFRETFANITTKKVEKVKKI